MGRRWVLALLAIALAAACGSPLPSSLPTATPGPTTSPLIEHPTGALDVVLRMSSAGGLPWYIGPTYTRPAEFTLYGDGRAIYLDFSGEPPELMQAQLNEEQVAAVLVYALREGGLAGARSQYSEAGIADDATTRFDINAGGLSKSVSVYAVSFIPDDGPDKEARQAFAAFADRLRGFGDEVELGDAVDLGEFAPLAYRVTLDQDFGPEVTANADWPWPDLDPADFGLVNGIGTGERVLQAQYGDAVMALGIWDGLIVTGPNGMLYQIKIQPLLPDDPNGPIALPV